MNVHIRRASEHNLKGIDVEFGDGLTAVTGVSGSGKTSLVFDTLYHEARRRFLEVFSRGPSGVERLPARVETISGLGPALAVGQNLLNRNPGSTLATASGLHPFFRLLYARFGKRRCAHCGAELAVLTEDEIVERLRTLAREMGDVRVYVPLVRGVRGSHLTLIRLLVEVFGRDALRVDGHVWDGAALDPADTHQIQVQVARLRGETPTHTVRQSVHAAWSLGAYAVLLQANGQETLLSRVAVCASCGKWFDDLEPVHFHTPCPHCEGQGCQRCAHTGLHPQAASVRWQGRSLVALLALSVDEARDLFAVASLPASAGRLHREITRRLEALHRVGLGYVGLDRSAPTLSRGESQRVRLAVALTSRLEDMLHILDEPTIGQHPADVARLLPAFRDLLGPVLFVEHDRIAVAGADRVVDLGPGAGRVGGEVVFEGTPGELWQADTVTGRYFSLRDRVQVPEARPGPERFLTVRGAHLRNLQGIDVSIPLGRLTVVTGVSGSGKSTFVEDVLAPTLSSGTPTGCVAVEGGEIKPVMVDQSPIGRNPRSNPATYTKLSGVIRDFFAAQTGLSPSHFSFNRPEGACPTCKGIGATEVRMRYLPSTWIPCADCGGQRFSDEVLAATVLVVERRMSIADVYDLSIAEVADLFLSDARLDESRRRAAERILRALCDIGLGYLHLGQPSPTLSGGEAQRVKLAKFLGQRSLAKKMLILDEPSTGLHAFDVAGLLTVLDRLVRSGATIVVVEHNTDVIRAGDWVIDLGPGAGPAGGHLVYSGPASGLLDQPASITGQALREEDTIQPRQGSAESRVAVRAISIRDARTHNLRGIDVDFPKGAMTVVTGVSGSGKSSLVSDILEAEARRRFLESLSLYERQGTKEGPEADAESVSGLGVAVTVAPMRRLHARRATVGTVTEIVFHLSALLSWAGIRDCLDCGTAMLRGSDGGTDLWTCPSCGATAGIARPRHFNPRHYAAACMMCNGVGTLRKPNPGKLIVHPDKPLCGGAMYSPGFFPKGYLCKPFNGGYYEVQAIAKRYSFDPSRTPWNEMSAEAQQAFLFGDPEPITFEYESRTGRSSTRVGEFHGFYRWIGDWDVGGTYTDTQICPTCGGGRLRPEYAAVKLAGHNLHALCEMPLSALSLVMQSLVGSVTSIVAPNLHTVLRRLGFLKQVGLSYVHLSRASSSLSAGEAQRIVLAGLLGSGLTSLTILLDEPSRGLHPSEVNALKQALLGLRDEGNTVVVVEHDLELIRAADHLLDMGPGAGTLGGEVVANGSPEQVAQADTVTGGWLRGERRVIAPSRRMPTGWMTILGAQANNLQDIDVRLPLGVLVGLCGVSGSGKSTLLLDTLGRVLAPKKQTTSVAYENIEPGAYRAIEGAPSRVILVDQSRRGVHSPASYLGLIDPIHRLYAQSEDAQSLGLDVQALSRRCAACRGGGSIRLEMGFLPDVHTVCEVCHGTGYAAEAWDVRLYGVALADLFAKTIDEVYDLFDEVVGLVRPLQAARDVGLGYLVLRQPGYALSGGEVQRLKIAKELCRKSRNGQETLYILDEPTIGQHLEDVARLNGVLHRLVDAGHSVFVIEHHPHMLAVCDWLVELGPGGGPEGGWIVAEGTPEKVAAGDTPTAPYVREILDG